MNQKDYIEAIGKSWDIDGFLGQLKEGVFDRGLYNELYKSLLMIDIKDDEEIQRGLIQVLWFVPIFMYRFKEYTQNISSREYDGLRENIEEQLARIFGYP